MKTRKILIMELFVLFVLVTVFVLTGNIDSFDNWIYQNVISVRSDLFDGIFIFLTRFANTIPVLCFTAALMIFLHKKERYMLGTSIVSIVGMNQLLKIIIQRMRPEHTKLILQGGFSYPSGHAMISIALYGFLIYYVYKYCKNKYWKVCLMVLLTLLIIGIGCSRIYVGVHYPSDIIGGYSLALGMLIIIIHYFEINFRGKEK